LHTLQPYIPLFQTILWLVFIILILVVYRKYIIAIFSGLHKRIEKGSSLKAFGVEIGEQKIVTKTSDIQNIEIYGNPDLFQLLFKAESSTFKKSTKAMQVTGGCIVQVTSEKINEDGSWSIAEGLTFVPNVAIKDAPNGNGRYLS
jgi:hypothetical protein